MVRSGFVVVLCLSGLVLFSLCVLGGASYIQVWFYLELCSLAVIPLFFLRFGVVCVESLYCFMLISGISSVLLVYGFLGELSVGFVGISLMLKFGLFPFFSWVYKVVVKSGSWCVVWVLSTFFKVPVFVVYLIFGGSDVYYLEFVSCASFIFLSFAFWVITYSWWHCWCHMMLSSSVVLFILSFVSSLDWLVLVFLLYCVWATLVICYFCRSSGLGVGGEGRVCMGSVFDLLLFVFLLLAVPVSLAFIYKVVSVLCVVKGCSFFFVCFWVMYSLSEQFYLFKLLVGTSSFCGFGLFRFV